MQVHMSIGSPLNLESRLSSSLKEFLRAPHTEAVSPGGLLSEFSTSSKSTKSLSARADHSLPVPLTVLDRVSLWLSPRRH